MFRSAPSFGIYITDTEIIAGSARRNKEIITVFARGKRSLPEGLVQDGVIMDTKQCGKMLKDLLLSLRLSTIVKNPVIVVPPQKVISTTIKVSSKGKKSEKEQSKIQAISQSIPVELSDLSTISAPLANIKDKSELVGVAAMRKDQLESIRKTCKEAGVSPKQIVSSTTSYFGAVSNDASGLLISSVPEATVTLFQKGFPVDEAIFEDVAKQDDILKEAEKMLVDAAQQNVPLKNVWVIGTPALLSKARELIKKVNVKAEANIILKDLNRKKEDQEFLPAMAASLMEKISAVNFISSIAQSAPVKKVEEKKPEVVQKTEAPTKKKSSGVIRKIALLLVSIIVIGGCGAVVYYTRIAPQVSDEKEQDVQEVMEEEFEEAEEVEEIEDEPESVPEVLTGAIVEQGTGATTLTGTGVVMTETGSSVESGTGVVQ